MVILDGELVRILRERRGLSQKELSELSDKVEKKKKGVSVRTISTAEKSQSISAYCAKKIADFDDTAIGRLYTFAE